MCVCVCVHVCDHYFTVPNIIIPSSSSFSSSTVQVFQPYAKFWLPVLTQLVVGGDSGGEGLHCFNVDVIATMLSWATTAILEVCSSSSLIVYIYILSSFLLQDRYLASRLLEYCMRNAHHSNRGVFRNNLEIVRTIVECWKNCLQVPTK